MRAGRMTAGAVLDNVLICFAAVGRSTRVSCQVPPVPEAKYCGKECQSTAWSEGHRFWCSAKEGDDAPDANAASSASNMATSASNATITPDAPDPNAIIPVGAERRERRERYAARERERLAAAATVNAILGGPANGGTTAADAATVRGFRSTGIFGAHPNTVSAVFGESRLRQNRLPTLSLVPVGNALPALPRRHQLSRQEPEQWPCFGGRRRILSVP
ncbi:hypothetical protein B0H13DRAFT_857557 [Mycena leptocephala]|nr:hypothetical protein B0H13DRAFT_857557 [Mycena leptocephala]